MMAKLNGKPIRCLFDSGCERSITAKSLVPDLPLACSCYILSAANKTDLPILGDAKLNFTIDGHKFLANVSVMPAIHDFLLGSDWLVKSKAKWDFAEGTISLGDRLIRGYQHILDNVCCCILVAKDYVVPPKHETNLPVKVLDDRIPHPPSDWAIEPRILEHEVMPAPMLFSDNHIEPVMCICNYSKRPYTFKADSFLGLAEPVIYVPRTGNQAVESSLASSDGLNDKISALLSEVPSAQLRELSEWEVSPPPLTPAVVEQPPACLPSSRSSHCCHPLRDCDFAPRRGWNCHQ